MNNSNNPLSYIDSHCHIDLILDKGDWESYDELKKEFPENFEKAIQIACDENRFDFAVKLAEHEEIYFAAGIHPHEAKDYTQEIEDKIIDLMKHPKAVAWGEIGLDYHYDYSPREIQKEVFKKQLILGQKLNKPLVIHTRTADDDTIEVMSKHLNPDLPIHIHCFTGSAEFAQELLNLGPNIYFGFTGVTTFKSAESIREAIKVVPLNRLLLETDSPFMAPVPYRGKTCHPGHIPQIAQQMADTREVSVEEIYKACRENTLRIYSI